MVLAATQPGLGSHHGGYQGINPRGWTLNSSHCHANEPLQPNEMLLIRAVQNALRPGEMSNETHLPQPPPRWAKAMQLICEGLALSVQPMALESLMSMKSLR